jgi:beta-glucosidase
LTHSPPLRRYLESHTTQIIAEAKHYVAYGYGNADGSPADVSLYTLYNVYLRPWRAFVAAGGRAVMVSHNSLNAIPMHSNAWALTDVLRGDLGCDNCLVATDFRDVQLLANFNTANKTR